MLFNRQIEDLLNWIRRFLFGKQRRSRLPYRLLATWGGLAGQQGYLHLVERELREGEPKPIATFLFRRKRFNGYARSPTPMDIYIELKCSQIPGHTHTLLVVAAEHFTRQDGFQCLPLHYGEYRWYIEDAPRSTRRRGVWVRKMAEAGISINLWPYRDRAAIAITFGVAYALLYQDCADWQGAIAHEADLILVGSQGAP